MKKLLIGAALVAALLLLPNPPKPPMKQCGDCNTWNEDSRTRCIGCQAPI